MHYSRQAATFTIDQQHAAILSCCDDLLVALGSASPLDQIGRVRMRLAGLLHANLALEETAIMAPIRRMAQADRPGGFSEIVEEAAGLRHRYSTHVGRWHPGAIGDDLAGYAEAAAVLIAQVRCHLEKKRRLLPGWRSCAPFAAHADDA